MFSSNWHRRLSLWVVLWEITVELDLVDQLCEQLKILFFVFFLCLSHVVTTAILRLIIHRLLLKHVIKGPSFDRWTAPRLNKTALFVHNILLQLKIGDRRFRSAGCCCPDLQQIIVKVVLEVTDVLRLVSYRWSFQAGFWSDQRFAFAKFEWWCLNICRRNDPLIDRCFLNKFLWYHMWVPWTSAV
jgi:hypothetical protein